jgi:hypothetical protein
VKSSITGSPVVSSSLYFSFISLATTQALGHNCVLVNWYRQDSSTIPLIKNGMIGSLSSSNVSSIWNSSNVKHQLDSACLWIFRPVVRITTSTCTSLSVGNTVILSHMIWVQRFSIETSPSRSQTDLVMVCKLIGSVKMEAECSYPDQSSLGGGTAGRVVGQKLQLSA